MSITNSIVKKVIAGNERLSRLEGCWASLVSEGKADRRVLDLIPRVYREVRDELNDVYEGLDVIATSLKGRRMTLVPHGMRVLDFLLSLKTAPAALVVVRHGSAKVSGKRDGKDCERSIGYSINFYTVDKDFVTFARKVGQVEKTRLFSFIPPEYRHRDGVIVDPDYFADGTPEVIIASDLLEAMEKGRDGLGLWEWDREARPVAFTEGRMYSAPGWHYQIIWFFDATQEKWLGWEYYPSRGRLIGDPDKPDFIADEPKDSAEFYKDPAWGGVDLQNYLRVISSVFLLDEPVATPEEFARAVAERPYESWEGSASFEAIPTPNDEWGWVYTTLSGRSLIWLPSEKTVFTRGMRESQNFRGTLEQMLGPAAVREEPAWLKAALTLGLSVARPCIGEYGAAPSEVSNEGFFAAIVRKPFGVYKEIVKVPEAPGHIFDFHAAQARETEYKAGRAVYEAWQAISGVIS